MYGCRFIIINDHKPLKSIFKRSITSCSPCIQKFYLHLHKKVWLRTSTFTQQRQASFRHSSQISLEPFRTRVYCRQFNPQCPFCTDQWNSFKTLLIRNKKPPYFANSDHLHNPWMARKEPHTHRFSCGLYPQYWYYILWMYEVWMYLWGMNVNDSVNIRVNVCLTSYYITLLWTNHSTHYPSSRKEIPYLPRTFRNWQSLFWPLMNTEIEDMIEKCPTCLTFWNSQPSEPIINHPIPNQVWTKITADSFCLYRHYYLLIIDHYSKFIVIETLNNLQSSTVITNCKKIF